MRDWLRGQRARLTTYYCGGDCGEPSYHDGHLSIYGKWRYLWSWRLRRALTSLFHNRHDGGRT